MVKGKVRLAGHSARAESGRLKPATIGQWICRNSGGFRLRLGDGVALRLRSICLSAYTPLPPLADRITATALQKNLSAL
jgi:hypothetical protein